jgi:hypothetical protein
MAEQEQLRKTKEKMMSEIKWHIEYHEKKLQEFKLQLELINQKNK